MDCPRCGTPIPEEEKNFCPFCFYVVESRESPKAEEKLTETPLTEPSLSLDSLPSTSNAGREEKEELKTVNVFGVKLKVKKRGWTDILSMDIKDALTGNFQISRRKEKAPLPSDIGEIPSITELKSEEEYNSYIDSLGKSLGFEVEAGFWIARNARKIWVRPLLKDFEFEEAMTFLSKLSENLKSFSEPVTALMVVPTPSQEGIFVAAIRKSQVQHRVNVISYKDLRQLVLLKESGYLKHDKILSLLLPLANLDLGQLIKIIKEVARGPL